ncbi:uncharacterized protein [Palaemon carinicauda]|uniref:uncharacterized protein n=1 Tax=Palaemon carinicauda TaxID=392227 RepID=UPI0035B60801
MKFVLPLVLSLAVACLAQLPCIPSKPKNLRIGYISDHTIGIEFEDPDDFDRCPISAYHQEIEKVVEATKISLANPQTPSDQSHYHDFAFLTPNTLYKITVTSLTEWDIASHPATIEAETLRN